MLLNRRGWAPTLLCLDCGHRYHCDDCSVPMVIHHQNQAICHWCGIIKPVPALSDCGSPALDDLGVGTQQLEEACRARFPDARIARLDSDTARSAKVLSAFSAPSPTGTLTWSSARMLAKGHDLPGVTLVGVICADQGLRIPDPRCAERVCAADSSQGAGRAESPGRVFFRPSTQTIQRYSTP